MTNNVAIIFEGGSMRCQFTGGVIDVLLENHIAFDACYGVSAGAMSGLSFKSNQIGRVTRVNLAFCNDDRYMGARLLATTGSFVGYDFIFNDIQDRIDPFDNDTYLANPMKLIVGVSDIVFGTPSYLEVKNAMLDANMVQASTSLPLLTQPVEIDGHLYLDGGVTDSVPVEHALDDDGYDRAVVVLTQHRSYQKEPYEFMAMARQRYSEYPYLLEALETRHTRYNEQREHIWELEREGKVLVLSPSAPVTVGHVEHDASKLLELYIDGRQQTIRHLDAIKDFVG